ncbi:hypothetical protein [Endozoicomonas sp. ONNA1]|uniref:hypothetical protein n=1 Tax=Endozoicomonas sp. ONNA1 TaxID=2828740 RepID=UPI0021486392|nr:hypothetical protein [Endozoicomonas sp. ONNA1]
MDDFNNKPPGLIDPPASDEDQLTLKTWMRQVTGAVRQGLGQIGQSFYALVIKSWVNINMRGYHDVTCQFWHIRSSKPEQ